MGPRSVGGVWISQRIRDLENELLRPAETLEVHRRHSPVAALLSLGPHGVRLEPCPQILLALIIRVDITGRQFFGGVHHVQSRHLEYRSRSIEDEHLLLQTELFVSDERSAKHSVQIPGISARCRRHASPGLHRQSEWATKEEECKSAPWRRGCSPCRPDPPPSDPEIEAQVPTPLPFIEGLRCIRRAPRSLLLQQEDSNPQHLIWRLASRWLRVARCRVLSGPGSSAA